MSKKILVVDDDVAICEILEFNLKSEGYEIQTAHSAEDALALLDDTHALILLDVMMGGMSGYRMVETMRKEGRQTPVIFITAKDEENDMLTGFSVGGDDYIAKPFSIKEVTARIKAVLRRHETKAPDTTQRLVFGDLSIHFSTKEVFIRDARLSLTKTEYEILVLLATHPEKVYPREAIIETIWVDAPYITERTVDVHITRLRKKLGDYGALITNRSGYGYRFNASAL